ncbi:GNAT family N-acetyltransferase [Candidatus Dependentiae bacterium]
MFPIVALQIERISFRRQFSGNLKDEEELFVRAFTYGYQNITKDILKIDNLNQRLRFVFSEERIDLNDPKKNIFVIDAYYKDRLVGFISFEEYDPSNKIYIRALAIDPSFIGKGLGKKLIFICNDYLPNAKKLILATRACNEKAIGFYKHLGFQKCEKVPHGWDPARFIGFEYDISDAEIVPA